LAMRPRKARHPPYVQPRVGVPLDDRCEVLHGEILSAWNNAKTQLRIPATERLFYCEQEPPDSAKLAAQQEPTAGGGSPQPVDRSDAKMNRLRRTRPDRLRRPQPSE
jgi:hypothetical protein